jgi:hypothetical protein
MLRSVKDKFGYNVLGIYCIPCECGKVYVIQTGHTITARCKYERHLWLQELEKSAVAEHSIETGHKIGFGEATVLAKSKGYMDRL